MQAGFVNVVVDTSDSLFAFDLDEGGASTADTSDGSGSTTTTDGSSTRADGSGTTADACPRSADAGRGAAADAPACPHGAEEETARRARNQVHVGSRG